jgi:hypothetical protein
MTLYTCKNIVFPDDRNKKTVYFPTTAAGKHCIFLAYVHVLQSDKM